MADKARKTAQQKAQEAVDLAQRKVNSLISRKAKAKEALEALDADLKEASANLTYVKSHPALTQPTEVAKPEPEVLPQAGEPEAPKDTLPPF